jgi:hypothetical protein
MPLFATTTYGTISYKMNRIQSTPRFGGERKESEKRGKKEYDSWGERGKNRYKRGLLTPIPHVVSLGGMVQRRRRILSDSTGLYRMRIGMHSGRGWVRLTWKNGRMQQLKNR